jgi:hypothetical protein
MASQTTNAYHLHASVLEGDGGDDNRVFMHSSPANLAGGAAPEQMSVRIRPPDDAVPGGIAGRTGTDESQDQLSRCAQRSGWCLRFPTGVRRPTILFCPHVLILGGMVLAQVYAPAILR